MNRIVLIAVAVVVLAGAAIGVSIAMKGGAASPESTMRSQVAALSNGDLATVMNTMPPSKLQELKAQWAAFRESPTTDQDKQQFGTMMSMLTAPNAEENLFNMAKPNLADAQQKLSMGVGMLDGMASSMFDQQKDMTAEDKANASKAMKAFTTWASGIDLTNEVKLKAAISTVVSTAKKLNVTSFDQLKKMSFDEMASKASTAFIGVNDVLASYGFNIRETVASTKIGTAAITGDTALVPVTITMLGHTFTSMATMKRIDGKWYGEDKPKP